MNKIIGNTTISEYNDFIQKGYSQSPFGKNTSCMYITTNFSRISLKLNSSFNMAFNYLDAGKTLPAVAIIAPHSIYKSLKISVVKLQHRDSGCQYRIVHTAMERCQYVSKYVSKYQYSQTSVADNYTNFQF